MTTTQAQPKSAAQTTANTEYPIECIFMFAGEEGIIHVKSTADADRDPLAIVKDWLLRSTGKQSASALHQDNGTLTVGEVYCPKNECIRQKDHASFHLDQHGVMFDDAGEVMVADSNGRLVRSGKAIDDD